MFFSKKLKNFNNIKHCFFSRKNGFSNGYYSSLNCGMGSNDKKENILKNLSFVKNKIKCGENRLITLNQIHSNKVVYIEDESSIKDKQTGDALVTKLKNVAIGILAADCAPIILYDPSKNIIGCIHSGWKGALSGIIKNTAKKFVDLNSNLDDVIAVVGPCIGQENYEVKEEFYKNFLSKNEAYKSFFKITRNGQYFFNLRNFVNNEINNLKIKKIENLEMDTFAKKEFFYSYRRSRINNELDYGRCISVILMT
tara:strand:- start:1020 stop:1781 length:762 start_codon:yes stop_codon:yes gene_type:complete